MEGGIKHFGSRISLYYLVLAFLLLPWWLPLDEPSEGLAPLIVAEIGRIIGQLREEGLSIVLVEQNLSLALGVTDRVYVMSKSQTVFEGIPTELRDKPEVLHQYLGV